MHSATQTDRPLVAITGADGFIGSHLTEHLVHGGYRVRAMAIYNSQGSYGWLDTLPREVMEHVDVRLGDVRDARSVRELMRDAQTVYHLAALIAIPYSYVAPQSYVDTNISGTLNVLEAARELGTGRVVHTSTSEVYGTARTAPIHETHPLQGQSPYSATKIGADKLAESYHLSFDLPVVTLRPFNTYGPRQSNRAVIPTIIAQIAAGRTEIKLGDTRPTRDFNYVSDTARAFQAVGEAGSDVLGQTLNAGSGREITIGDTVKLIAETMGTQVEIKQENERLRPEGSEVMRLLADHQALQRLTGWAPTVPLEEGLRRTAAWFTNPANLARYRVDQYVI
ncbi:NAD-dependent epimerase/dehydratase family protein [Deinococcus cavernae]|uniref:NAD-dependent epimerase/dehydratase family protein n=1 Tax=Deinococcus cavernae TaxID=2320857 RepID=A0A418V7C1_9DEIO|nr:GDP-mannose 4,6-dehydratase [Deinococcus cavernae]RJF71959.1 NAD-dependent epimerase/dehydratase family protein [Deinococcus cavernae]